MEAIADILTYISEFFAEIYDFVDSVFERLLVWLAVFYIEIKISIITLAWDVAGGVLSTLNISSTIDTAWAGLDSKVLGYITFFRIPEALNIILQAGVTKFILRGFS
ncbi:DUF2523 domain-containing protein [Aestuariicella sp. G3-2]|uniref:DUF2523 family protein n=1 Tax=Pseudomaricurvus albidus TaxID=2842452 RepID=UPI001C0E88C1|nr:DUF2523 family protein [Aestuariicella albida]MBU3068780.1 DUF2523 domain-containing protein [Aestuariicella albida]